MMNGRHRARLLAEMVSDAQHYLSRQATPPPCRFDVVAIEGNAIVWLTAAFDAE